MIRVQGLAKRFGDRRVLAGVDLELADGLLLVTGPNGSGKTTLLRILARLAAPSAGSSSCRRARRSATSATARTSIAS